MVYNITWVYIMECTFVYGNLMTKGMAKQLDSGYTAATIYVAQPRSGTPRGPGLEP